MRKLNGTDIFAFARVIRASGMREELKKLIDSIAKRGEGANLEDIGFDAILTVFEALAEKKSEQAIWELLASPLEMSAKEVAQLELKDLFTYLQTIAEENDLKSFFSYVSAIVGKN